MTDLEKAKALVAAVEEAGRQGSVAIERLDAAQFDWLELNGDVTAPFTEIVKATQAAAAAGAAVVVALGISQDVEQALSEAMTRDGMPEGSSTAAWLERVRSQASDNP